MTKQSLKKSPKKKSKKQYPKKKENYRTTYFSSDSKPFFLWLDSMITKLTGIRRA